MSSFFVMELTLEQVKNLKPLKDEDLALATREELIGLIRGEQSLRSSIISEFIAALTREMVLQDKVFKAEETFVRFRTTVFNKRSEKLKPHRAGSKKKKKHEKKEAEDTTKLPSQRYPNVDIIERIVECEKNPSCPCCGDQMPPVEMFDVSEALTVIPRKFVIVRQKKRKYRCSSCKSGIATTPTPPRIIPGSSYGDELIIDACISKYCDLMPMERYCKVALMQGVEGLPANSLIETSHKLAELLKVNHDKVRSQTLENRVLMADETYHRMLEGHKKNRWNLWGFSSVESCFFEYHPTRSAEVASNILINSKCEVLVTDLYSGYGKAARDTNELRKVKGIEIKTLNAYCNSHARRAFVFDSERGDSGAEYMIKKYGKVFAIEKQSKGKSKEDILLIRKDLVPHFEEMREFAASKITELSEKSALYNAYNYLLENYKELTYFIGDHETPMTNNQSERLLRSPVIGRKTWYGSHSPRGAETAAIHQTLIESCKLIDMNPREYYRESVFRHLQNLEPLTPLEMKRMLSAQASAA
ncbi:MAG: IS66 family transposase [Proteobacteria bacterium]|nr:IS66 family transposase [Pseudomonadota bacterium]